MLRMVVTACFVLVISIIFVFPVIEIEQAQHGTGCRARNAMGCSFARHAEAELKAIETVASALAQTTVSSVRTLICLGGTSIEVYRALNGPTPGGRS